MAVMFNDRPTHRALTIDLHNILVNMTSRGIIYVSMKDLVDSFQ